MKKRRSFEERCLVREKTGGILRVNLVVSIFYYLVLPLSSSSPSQLFLNFLPLISRCDVLGDCGRIRTMMMMIMNWNFWLFLRSFNANFFFFFFCAFFSFSSLWNVGPTPLALIHISPPVFFF